MTRAQLVSLRNSSQLIPFQRYVITDFTQGRFFAGTTITVTASSVNELLETVDLNSLYDNEGWFARYDCDTNNLLEVRDNIGNVVYSNTVGRVAAWDWGNGSVYNNVCSGDVQFTYGASIPFYNNTVGPEGVVTRTTAIGGSMNACNITGLVNLTGSNATLNTVDVLTGSQIVATGYTGSGTTFYRLTVSEQSTVNLTNTTQPVQMLYSKVGSLSNVTISTTTTAGATANIYYTDINSGAAITHNGAVSPLTVQYTTLSGLGTNILHTTGPLTVTGCSMHAYARILFNAPTTTTVGTGAINYTSISGGTNSYIQHQGTGAINITNCHIDGGYVNVIAGSLSVTTVSQTNITSGGYVQMNANSTAGNLSLQSCEVTSAGYVNKSSTGALTANYCFFTGNGRIDFSSVRNLNATAVTCSNVGRISCINATTGSGVADAIAYTTITDYSYIQFNADGAAPNTVYYSSIQGNYASLIFSGTQTGATLSGIMVRNGTMLLNNNTVAMPTILAIDIVSGGNLTLQNCTAARDIRYSTVADFSTWTFSACTVAGQTFGVSINARGQLTHTATAADFHYSSVQQGAVVHNGGSSLFVTKTLGGTLTTGAFAQSNIMHHSWNARTLTAANTNRSEIGGFTSTTPLI
jgi:hypothetical protein